LFFSRQGIFRFDSPVGKWGVCYVAADVETAFLEVYADAIRKKALAYPDLDDRMVWKVSIPSDLNLLRLSGPTLSKIKATLQCFVSRYTLSQAWGRAFMEHPANLDGVIYQGRQSGSPCVALFGDEEPKKGKSYQSGLVSKCLGKLTEWDGFFPCIDKTGARVTNLPSSPPSAFWRT